MAKSRVDAEMTHVSPTRAARWLKDRQYIVDDELRQRKLRQWHADEILQAILQRTFDGLVTQCYILPLRGPLLSNKRPTHAPRHQDGRRYGEADQLAVYWCGCYGGHYLLCRYG